MCFTEQRPVFAHSIEDSFFERTERKTLKIIHKYSEQVNKFIVFSTVGLWSEHDGEYNIDTPYSFDRSSYLLSKYELTENTIYNDQVITVFPCNFNSKYRKEGYLFRKLVLAVLENQKSEIGNLDFLREMSHAKYISKRLVEVQESGII